MVKRDYIKRGTSGERRRKSVRKTVGFFEKSTVLCCLAVSLLVAHSVVLYWLTQRHVVPLSRPGQQHLLAPVLPSKPKERWRYIKALEDKEISVRSLTAKMPPPPTHTPLPEETPGDYFSTKSPYKPLSPRALPTPIPVQRPPGVVKAPNPPSATAPPLRWTLQCGSFRSIEQAQSFRASLAFLGIESDVRQDNGWQRVVVGPYSSRELMDSALKRLKQTGLHHCISVASKR